MTQRNPHGYVVQRVRGDEVEYLERAAGGWGRWTANLVQARRYVTLHGVTTAWERVMGESTLRGYQVDPCPLSGPLPGDTDWEAIAHLLGHRMQHHGAEGACGHAELDDNCPFCADRSAYLAYRQVCRDAGQDPTTEMERTMADATPVSLGAIAARGDSELRLP